jgi:SanA protein
MAKLGPRILIIILILAIASLAAPLALRGNVSLYIYRSVDATPEVQVVIVPGASVISGRPSPVLQARTDAAIALYRAGKAHKILVTGDNGALSHDEVTPVRKYLVDAGIPPQDIFLDHAGFDTYSSMYRASAVFAATSSIIVTQDFHLPRALWIARHVGLNAYGLVVEEHMGSLYDYAREIPATWKALFDVTNSREPQYLGPVLPLSGDGQATWY